MKSKFCRFCAFYIPYYHKLNSSYARQNHGFCCKHKNSQTPYEHCEDFKSNEEKEKRREEKLLADLESSLTSINEISQILRERYYK